MPVEVRSDLSEIKGFATLIVAGLALHWIGGVLAAWGVLRTDWAGFSPELPVYAWVGVLAGVGGIVCILMGLYRLLGGLHSAIAHTVFRR